MLEAGGCSVRVMGWLVGIGVLIVATIIGVAAIRDETRALKSTSYADRAMLPGKPIRRRAPDDSEDSSPQS
jgi:hypothetical protein